MMFEISRLLKIKTILMYQSIFPNKYFMLNNYEKLGEIGNLDIIEKNRSKNFDIENFMNLYRETIKKYKFGKWFKNGEHKDLAKWILEAYQNKKILKQMGQSSLELFH